MSGEDKARFAAAVGRCVMAQVCAAAGPPKDGADMVAVRLLSR